MNTPHALETILADLTDDERQELAGVVQGMHVYASEDIGLGELPDPDGMTRLLTTLSPNVKNKLYQLHALTSESRGRPFDPKLGLAEWADTLGLDPTSLGKYKDLLDAADVVGKLHHRMGGGKASARTDSEHRRDAVRAAFEADQPLAQRRAFAEQMIREASPTLSRRDAISALVDATERMP